MAYVLTNAEKIRRLPWSYALNATNTVYAQLTFFGSAFVLFLSMLRLSNTQIGFLLSLIPLAGLVALVVAPAVARFGYKRTFVTFWGIRKLVTIGLLFVPLVQSQFGAQGVLIYVTLITGGFALCRSIAETGMYPWAQEFIPNTIRGRYLAINDVVSRLSGIAAIGLASFVLGLTTGFDGFLLLFAIAIVFGFVTVWSAAHIPGGAPTRHTRADNVSYRHLFRVLRDRNFLLYMAGLGVLLIGTTPMVSFLPLYMNQQIGLNDSQVVLLQIGVLAGGLTATYLFGWAADRYGSKPVLLFGVYIKLLLPIAWMLLPRSSTLSLTVALVIAAVQGISEIAWAIGSGRLLYVKVVPSEKSGEYMAVYSAMLGLITGLSQLIGGRVLDFTQHLSGQFLIFTVDPFFPLFVFGLLLTVICVILFSRVQPDSPVSVTEFAGLFVHGNPLLALESVFRYYRARDERQTVVITERMAQTRSPLTVNELLEALKDPRFNVRFEAIISIAHMNSDPQLVKALCDVVEGTELSLSVIAAWALGRIGDEQAIPSLRKGLYSSYRSIQAHCARALGTLGDTSTAPLLLERLQTETDKGLRIAYSSALGNLRSAEAIPKLLETLLHTENEGARLELALALARIVGHEHHFIRLLRQMRQDKGTAVSQSIAAAKRQLLINDNAELRSVIADCENAFAKNDFEQGIVLLNRILGLLPPDSHSQDGKVILEECGRRLAEFKADRVEYLLLTLHTLTVAVESWR